MAKLGHLLLIRGSFCSRSPAQIAEHLDFRAPILLEITFSRLNSGPMSGWCYPIHLQIDIICVLKNCNLGILGQHVCHWPESPHAHNASVQLFPVFGYTQKCSMCSLRYFMIEMKKEEKKACACNDDMTQLLCFFSPPFPPNSILTFSNFSSLDHALFSTHTYTLLG